MIKVEGIPSFQGNLQGVIDAAGKMVTVGNQIVGIAEDLESKFRNGMNAHYIDGPEKHLLVDAMLPVKNEGKLFGPELGKVAAALKVFVDEVRGNVDKLNGVKGRAEAWKRKVGDTPEDEIDDNEDWVKEENQLHKDISDSMQAITEAENRCANKIAALYGGRKWDEKSGHRDGDPEPPASDEEKEPPWGKPLEYDAPWYEDVGNFALGVLKGVFVDGILGTLDALTTLIPIQPLLKSMGVNSIFGHELQGWKECGQAWKGVGLTLASAAMYAVPGAGRVHAHGLPGDRGVPGQCRNHRAEGHGRVGHVGRGPGPRARPGRLQRDHDGRYRWCRRCCARHGDGRQVRRGRGEGCQGRRTGRERHRQVRSARPGSNGPCAQTAKGQRPGHQGR
ncbi:hypothetical protein [Kribbella qitaiheensis]|uniref:hypothetical protein n=1 Tax=Kribbella qitaiheensis TaxID=1544730 RepID=UPI001FE8EA77|nr:hypothetical protein [Kribbella qitaiheensis]